MQDQMNLSNDNFAIDLSVSVVCRVANLYAPRKARVTGTASWCSLVRTVITML